MVDFRHDNGEEGILYTSHTTTGYKCIASSFQRDKQLNDGVIFYAKHIVGSDGHPYTEVGLSGLLDNERQPAINQIKNDLKNAGFIEVMDLSSVANNAMAYSEHKCADHDSVAVRVCAGKGSISKIVDILAKMIFESSREFVKEQESIPDVLFESILDSMGEEMDRGPGGHDMAVKKARDLANLFENGIIWENSLMN